MKSIAAAFLFTALQALAQQPAPAAAPRPIVLRAARLFDGTSDTIIRNGVVKVVKGDSALLSVADVTDWSKLLAALNTASGGDACHSRHHWSPRLRAARSDGRGAQR